MNKYVFPLLIKQKMSKLLLTVFAIFAGFFIVNYFLLAIVYSFRSLFFLLVFGLVCYSVGRFHKPSKN